MTAFEFMIVHIYLLAIFALVVKNKVNPMIYSTIKVLVLVLIITTLIDFFTNLSSISWQAVWVIAPLLIVFIILVQSEVKTVLILIGMKSGLLISNAIEDEVKEEMIHAIETLSKKKIGAIITFERSNTLKDYIDNAFQIEAKVTSELIGSIFMPNTPLHDGAIIIKENVIKCAGAYFPPSESDKIPKYLGSRHRAAIGISEQTDSFTIIVSEETGAISVTIDGYLDQDISKESLVLYLEKYLQN